jgi:hypothetical protein
MHLELIDSDTQRLKVVTAPPQDQLPIQFKCVDKLPTSCQSSSFSCTCICITKHFFSLTDTAASASAVLLQQTANQHMY